MPSFQRGRGTQVLRMDPPTLRMAVRVELNAERLIEQHRRVSRILNVVLRRPAHS